MARGRLWARLTDRWRDDARGSCACGHAREAHEHYRAGSDCALCDCPRYRRV